MTPTHTGMEGVHSPIMTPLLTPLRSIGSGNNWSIIDSNGSHLGSGFEPHTASDICRAVNSHAELVATLTKCADVMDSKFTTQREWIECVKEARLALANAGGGK